MSDEPNNKRRKMSGSKKNKFFGAKKANILEPGIKGFLATCNFREKDCVRECYNLLNEYNDENGESAEKSDAIVAPPKEIKAEAATNSDEDEDISTQLENEIKTMKTKRDKTQFQQVETKTPNCIFIKTTIESPLKLGEKIIRDIFDTKQRKTRILLRFIPIDAVCRADLTDITNAAGKLFDKYFLNVPPKTFAIVVNKRYNNSIDRMKVIKELADIVVFKNIQHKVDLKNAELTVVVEVIRGLCCLAVLPDYIKLKKFNLAELVGPVEKKDDNKMDETTDEKQQEANGSDVVVKVETEANNDHKISK